MQAGKITKSTLMTIIFTAVITGSVVWGLMKYITPAADHTVSSTKAVNDDQPNGKENEELVLIIVIIF